MVKYLPCYNNCDKYESIIMMSIGFIESILKCRSVKLTVHIISLVI